MNQIEVLLDRVDVMNIADKSMYDCMEVNLRLLILHDQYQEIQKLLMATQQRGKIILQAPGEIVPIVEPTQNLHSKENNELANSW